MFANVSVVGYAAQSAKMTPLHSMPEAQTLWLEKYGEMCFLSRLLDEWHNVCNILTLTFSFGGWGRTALTA
jgi:hypothetical protein